MFKRNLKFAAFIAAVGASTFVIKKLSENEELKTKVKDEGKKVIDGTKELTKAVSKATSETATELKDKFEQDNPELAGKIRKVSTTVIEKGKEIKNKIKIVCDEAFVPEECEYELDEEEVNTDDLTVESIVDDAESKEKEEV